MLQARGAPLRPAKGDAGRAGDRAGGFVRYDDDGGCDCEEDESRVVLFKNEEKRKSHCETLMKTSYKQ